MTSTAPRTRPPSAPPCPEGPAGASKPIRWRALRRPPERPHVPLSYVPALDGIRGLAVAAVFAFHVGAPWATGGFLGVSVFFTLSGFLIGSLLLDEGHTAGRIDLARFWARRLRRLLPASLATAILVLVLGVTVLDVDPATLRGDVFGALGYAANWRFLYTDASYTALFSSPSPVLHFWSLAIEEQYYLVFPLVVAATAAIGARRRRPLAQRLRTVVLVGIAGSLVATWIASRAGDTDFVYYSLPTRAAELLVGVLLATTALPGRLRTTTRTWWPTLLGIAALGGTAALIATSTTTSSWLYDGGLSAFALLSVALVTAALAPGPLSRLLASPPLRGLGLISYGVYLYHWPIVLWLDRDRMGLHGVALASVQAAVTLALAIVSYFVLEQPVRRGRVPRGRIALGAAPAGIAAVVVLAIVLTASAATPSHLDFDNAARQLQRNARAAAAAAEAADVPIPRVGVFGDSTALQTGLGLSDWGLATGEIVPMASAVWRAWLGCGILRDGFVRYDQTVNPTRIGCGDWAKTWGQDLATDPPDVAVMQVGPFDVADHQFPNESQWRSPGDPVYDEHLKSEMLGVVDLFIDHGVTLVWLTSPDIEVGRNRVPPLPAPDPASDPGRMARFNAILREVQRERPALRVVDLARWLRNQPGGQFDPTLRPDGVHFTRESAGRVAAWLGPEILRVTRDRPGEN